GAHHVLDGNNMVAGLQVTSGNVTIENLTIENARAQGATGFSGGGGGAGLGGGLLRGGHARRGDLRGRCCVRRRERARLHSKYRWLWWHCGLQRRGRWHCGGGGLDDWD